MMVMGRTHVGTHRRKSSSDSSNTAFQEPLRALELAFREADARVAEGYRRRLQPGGPTLVEHGPLRLLISSSPSTDSVARYAHTVQGYGVRHVVRVCEPTYAAIRLRGTGLAVHDWAFADGDAPPQTVVDAWLALLDDVFGLAKFASDPHAPRTPPTETVAVHCHAGLGRAPVLVAVALVEAGMDPFEAVGWIRALRRGAINSRQMAFLEAYQPRPRTPQTQTGKNRKQRPGAIVGSFLAGFKARRPRSPRNIAVAAAGSR